MIHPARNTCGLRVKPCPAKCCLSRLARDLIAVGDGSVGGDSLLPAAIRDALGGNHAKVFVLGASSGSPVEVCLVEGPIQPAPVLCHAGKEEQ